MTAVVVAVGHDDEGAPTGFGATLVVSALIGWRVGPWWREPGAPLPAKSPAKSAAKAPATAPAE